MKNKFIFTFVFFFLQLYIQAQILLETFDDIRVKEIVDEIQLKNKLLPEKLCYLQTDKQNYNLGETIWFKAFYLNKNDLTPDTVAYHIYAELINWKGNSVLNKRIQLKNGVATGEFYISDTFSDGNYKLRIYTHYLLNFPEEKLFSKLIHISNPNPKNFYKTDYNFYKELKRKWKRENPKINVEFFPESGVLCSNLPTEIFVKATDEYQKPIKIEGEIKDEEGKLVGNFSTNEFGIGKFNLVGRHKQKYRALIPYKKRIFKKKLPEISEFGVNLSVKEQNTDSITLEISTNRPVTDDRNFNDIILIAYSKAKVFYTKILDGKKPFQKLNLHRKIIPTGVTYLSLYNGRKQLLCETNIIIPLEQSSQIKIVTNKTSYKQNELVLAELLLPNTDSLLKFSSISISVNKIENTELFTPLTNKIGNYFQFASEISLMQNSIISKYFQKQQTTENDLRMLFLTHKNNKVEKNKLDYSEENKISIEGYIYKDIIKVFSKNSPVKLSLMNQYNDVFDTNTDSSGYFIFDNLEYFDTMEVKLEARNKAGRKAVYIEVIEKKPESKSFWLEAGIDSILLNSKGIYRKEKTENENKDDGKYRIYGNADSKYYPGTEAQSSTNVLEMIKGRFPGVNVTGNNVVIRGINSFYSSSDRFYWLMV